MLTLFFGKTRRLIYK